MNILTDIYFKSEPQPYQYGSLNQITFIQCPAVRTNNDREAIPIAATPYRNSERLLTGVNLPDRHQLLLLDGVVAGIVITPTRPEDGGVRYHCEIERDGEVVRVSTETQLLVGGVKT